MSGYIKREDVMKRRHGCDRDCKSCDFFTDGDSWCQGEIFVVDLLCVPSADVVERKKGEWMFDDPISADFECSECLHRQDYCTRYCPNCGALMWEEDEET